MMKPLLYTFFLCWIAARCFSLEDWEWPKKGCPTKGWFDYTECVYHLYCVDYVDTHAVNMPAKCKPPLQLSDIRDNNNRTLIPLFLHFKSSIGKYGAIPPSNDDFALNETVLLDLSNNEYLSSPTLTLMPYLIKLNLSGNLLTSAKLSNSKELNELKELDFSYNIINMIEFNLEENIFLKLEKLNLSHNNFIELPNETFVQFDKIKTLDLSHNRIRTINSLTFAKLKDLRKLDLSYNKILFIQPGSFRNNIFLFVLNISHNAINTIGYGAFAGLKSLNTLDVSYNIMDNLDNEIFYGLTKLTILIADFNKINSFEASEFANTSLSTLSIGGNPIPCDLLKKLNTSSILTFSITAITLDESKENFHGVTCNINIDNGQLNNSLGNYSAEEFIMNYKTDILVKMSLAKLKEITTKYFEDILNAIEKSNSNVNKGLTRLVAGNNKTNDLLNKLINIITDKPFGIQVNNQG